MKCLFSASCLVVAMVAAGGSAAQAQSAVVDLCKAQGSPSYTAIRTVVTGDKTIKSRVYIAKGMEREDTKFGDEMTVRISLPDKVVIFNPDKKTGVAFNVPTARPGNPPPKPDDKNFRKQTSQSGDEHTTSLQTRQNETWVDMIKVVCRTDGVVLRREFPVELKGKLVRAVVAHSEIEVRALEPSIFEAPKDVQLAAPPPPPAGKSQ